MKSRLREGCLAGAICLTSDQMPPEVHAAGTPLPGPSHENTVYLNV